MKKERHNNLLWAVLSTAIVFSLVVVFDSPVYAAYRTQHADVPAPAVMMLAASEGISPLDVSAAKTSVAEAPVKVSAVKKASTAANTVQAAAKTEIAKPVQLASSVGGPGVPAREQPLPASEGAAQDAAQNAAGQDAATQDAAGQNAGGPGEAGPGAAAQPQFVTADMSYFDDACFVGDSFTQGLSIYSKNPGANYYYAVGVSTSNALSKNFTLPGGGEGKLIDALAGKQYKKVYIMLGINEMSNGDPAAFAQRYAGILQQIRTVQPNATIFIQSILHTTPEKSASTNFKNEYINRYNEAIKGLADNTTIYYIDINPLFDDGNGAMKAELSGDGVHLKAQHYIPWRDLLLRTVPASLAPATTETQTA